jgi:RimJ/RimL family protein N-acetyltransferase
MAGMPERIEIDERDALRRHTREDAQALLDIVLENLDELHLWMPWAKQAPSLEFEQGFIAESIEHWEQGVTYNMLAVRGDDVLGGFGFWPVPDGAEGRKGEWELGYWLDRASWGRGICTRSVLAIIDTARANVGVTRFRIVCDEANVRSAAVAQRAGFTLGSTVTGERTSPGDSGRKQIWMLGM